MRIQADRPVTRVLPPLYYCAAMLFGFLLSRRWALSIPDGRTATLSGTLLLVSAIALMLSGATTFWRAGTTVHHDRPATKLVAIGPYRFTRNPIYLGFVIATIAFGVLVGTWWPILLLIPVQFIVHRFVIKPEEAYLARRFGHDYRAYTGRVRRWL